MFQIYFCWMEKILNSPPSKLMELGDFWSYLRLMSSKSQLKRSLSIDDSLCVKKKTFWLYDDLSYNLRMLHILYMIYRMRHSVCRILWTTKIIYAYFDDRTVIQLTLLSGFWSLIEYYFRDVWLKILIVHFQV